MEDSTVDEVQKMGEAAGGREAALGEFRACKTKAKLQFLSASGPA